MQPNSWNNLKSRCLTGKRYSIPEKVSLKNVIRASCKEQTTLHTTAFDNYDDEEICDVLNDRETIEASGIFSFNPTFVSDSRSTIGASFVDEKPSVVANRSSVIAMIQFRFTNNANSKPTGDVDADRESGFWR